MKTYVNFWLLSLMLLFLGTVEVHAQRFYFKELFTKCEYTYGKNQTPQTFTPIHKLYNHQWKLTVDGVLAKANTDCLHVGTGNDASQIICLETTTSFKDVDLVRVSTNIADKRGVYKVGMTLSSDNGNFSDTHSFKRERKVIQIMT